MDYNSRMLWISIKRAIRWLRSIVCESIIMTVTVLCYAFGYLSKNSCGSTKGRPILLIHGYLYNASVWMFLKWSLSRGGFGPVYTLNLFYPFRSICHYADFVSVKVDEIFKQTSCKDVVLIGHSMGGLVATWYALKIAQKGKVKQVITIGSPLQGTHIASVIAGLNGSEMEWSSDFIQTLQNEIQKNNEVPLYHIASTVDQVIWPHLSALTGLEPEREYVVDNIGHMTLLFSSRVAKQIKKWLEN